MSKTPKIGSVWKFNSPGNPQYGRLYVIESFGRIKVKDGEWVDGVTYWAKGNSRELYTRDLETFLNKFVRQPAKRKGFFENARCYYGPEWDQSQPAEPSGEE